VDLRITGAGYGPVTVTVEVVAQDTLTSPTLTGPTIVGATWASGQTVTGDLAVTGNLAIAGSYDNTKTDPTTSTAFNVHRTQYTFGAAILTGTQYGHYVEVTYNGATSQADMRAVAGQTILAGAGAVAQAFGVYGRVSKTGPGVVGVAYAHYGVIQNTNGSGTITNAHAFYAFTPNLTNGGLITNAFGLNVENQGAAGVTNAYGVRIRDQSGASTINVCLQVDGLSRFAGNAEFRSGDNLAAGGSMWLRFTLTPTTTPQIGGGAGAPSVVAPKGSLYLRSDGSSTSTRAYIATDSVGGWAAVTTAS
jgi:hypothetical protein